MKEVKDEIKKKFKDIKTFDEGFEILKEFSEFIIGSENGGGSFDRGRVNCSTFIKIYSFDDFSIVRRISNNILELRDTEEETVIYEWLFLNYSFVKDERIVDYEDFLYQYERFETLFRDIEEEVYKK